MEGLIFGILRYDKFIENSTQSLNIIIHSFTTVPMSIKLNTRLNHGALN